MEAFRGAAAAGQPDLQCRSLFRLPDPLLGDLVGQIFPGSEPVCCTADVVSKTQVRRSLSAVRCDVEPCQHSRNVSLGTRVRNGHAVRGWEWAGEGRGVRGSGGERGVECQGLHHDYIWKVIGDAQMLAVLYTCRDGDRTPAALPQRGRRPTSTNDSSPQPASRERKFLGSWEANPGHRTTDLGTRLAR